MMSYITNGGLKITKYAVKKWKGNNKMLRDSKIIVAYF